MSNLLRKGRKVKLADSLYKYQGPGLYVDYCPSMPEYGKIGDTSRDPLTRLSELRRRFHDMTFLTWTSSILDDAKSDVTVYTRDLLMPTFARKKGIKHLDKKDFPLDKSVYSKEFWKIFNNQDLSLEDRVKIASNILNEYKQFGTDLYNNGSRKDLFYTLDKKQSSTTVKEREYISLNPLQEGVVKNFVDALKNKLMKLIMVACCRFGKIRTTIACLNRLESMDNSPKLFLCVCGMDVKSSWFNEITKYKECENWEFLDAKDLHDTSIIDKHLQNSKTVFVYINLQDFFGKGIKFNHKDLFKREWDTLIVDETHFCTRSLKMRDILENDDDTVSFEDADEKFIKKLKYKLRLDMTGTAEKIMMTSEYSDSQILCNITYSDLIRERDLWYKNHPDEPKIKNPYYGLPNILYYIPEYSEKVKEKLENQSFGDIYDTYVDENGQLRFKQEDVVTEEWLTIDGALGNKNISFLDNDDFKAALGLIHAIVKVTSCKAGTALKNLLERLTEEGKFKNLNKYRIFNLTGVNKEDKPDFKTFEKNITEAVKDNRPTLSITVRRMLTGTTIPYWNMFIFQDDTASYAEYVQSRSRVLTKWVIDETGEIKKPNAIIIDPKASRCIEMIMQQAEYTNRKDCRTKKIEDTLSNMLEYSSVFYGSLEGVHQLDENIITAFSAECNANKNLKTAISDIPIDLSDFEKDTLFREELLKIPAFDTTKKISMKIDSITSKNGKAVPKEYKFGDPNNLKEKQSKGKKKSSNYELLENRLRDAFCLVILYSFLTKDKSVNTLLDIKNQKMTSEDRTTLKDIGLSIKMIYLLNKNIGIKTRRRLDHYIRLTNNSKNYPLQASAIIKKFNKINENTYITPMATCKEMVTPIIDGNTRNILVLDTAGEYVHALVEVIKHKWDTATTEEEKAKYDLSKYHFYVIPRNRFCRALLKKSFESDGLYLADIASFTWEDVINLYTSKQGNMDKLDEFMSLIPRLSNKKAFSRVSIKDIEKLKNYKGKPRMKIDAVVGNPPYQKLDGGGKGSSAIALYPYFVNLAKRFNPKYISMIIPSRWMVKSKGTEDFKASMLDDERLVTLHDYFDANDIFKNINLPGGICIFLRDRDKDINKECDIYTYSKGSDIEPTTHRFLRDKELTINNEHLDIFFRIERMLTILRYVANEKFESFSSIVSARKPYGFCADVIANPSKYGLPEFSDAPEKNGFNLFGLNSLYERCVKYLSADYPVPVLNEALYKYKVYLAKGNGSPAIGEAPNTILIGEPFIGKPGDLCTETFLLIGVFDTEEEALACLKYIKSKFFRCLLGIMKQTQNICRDTFRFVPLQDFTSNSDIDWSKSIHEIDLQLYAKYGLSQKEIDFIEKNIKEMV